MLRAFAYRMAIGVAAASWIACGDPMLNANEPGSTLFTVNGRLTNTDALEVDPELYVAVVWAAYDFTGGDVDTITFVSQTVQVTSFEFPANFSVDLTELPPAAAMASFSDVTMGASGESSPSPSDGRYAYGMLVAFEDLDGDGQLTLPNLTTTELPDRIVGITGEEAMLVFIEGEVPPQIIYDAETNPYGSIDRLDPGFNLIGQSPEYSEARAALLAVQKECEDAAGEDWDAMAGCWETYLLRHDLRSRVARARRGRRVAHTWHLRYP